MIITSNRYFGIEIETGFPTREAQDGAVTESPRSWQVTTDGSLRDNNVPHGLEFISSKIRGVEGERTVRRISEILSDHGADPTHNACGFHVHVDMSELMNTKRVVVSEKPKKLGRTDYIFSPRQFNPRNDNVDLNISRQLLNFGPVDAAFMYRYQGKFWFLWDSEREGFVIYRPSDKTKFSMEDILVEKTRCDKVIQQDYNKGNALFVELTQKIIKSMSSTAYMVEVYDDSNVAKLKAVWGSYLLYSRVFQGMVADSRKSGNSYCQHMSEIYSIEDLRKASSMDELKKLWYLVKDKRTADQRSRDRYDNSRYQDVNLHNLWSRTGTIEFRSHGGTIDWRKITLWTALHQFIVDKCLSGEVTLEILEASLPQSKDLDDIVLAFFQVFQFPVRLEKYVRKSITFFSSDECRSPLY